MNFLVIDGATDKVCFFSHSSLLGGAERSMFELIKLLQQKGIKCSVVMKGEGPLKSKCIELGIIVKSVKFMPWWCAIYYDRLKLAHDIKSFIEGQKKVLYLILIY